MALAKGTSRISIGRKELTSHSETTIKVAELMLGDRGLRFNLTKSSSNDYAPYILECEGVGLVNNFFK